MDAKTKELIAIGAAVGAHCIPCLKYHVEKARSVGLDDTAIKEAIGVGEMVQRGAMSEMKKFSTDLMEGVGT